ncbi:hypothetical protein acdb102_17110 [Acidothermaceae bacterium B102]|nr:hypothetical protein acdb102_17110 [Acidothermaceae bacterium B102]
MMSRLVKSMTAGMVLATAVLTLLVVGGVVLAVSTEHQVHIPLLLTARSGKGADLLGLEVQAPGLVLWFLVLSALVTLPLLLARRSARAYDPR